MIAYMPYEDIKAHKSKLTEEEYLELLYYNYPSLWIEEYIPDPLDNSKMITLRPYQSKVIDTHMRRRIVRFGRQCLTGDTQVQMSDGTLKEIKDIIVGDAILSFNSMDNTIISDVVTDQWSNGIRPIYKITTQFGRTIRTTSNHPFFVKQQRCDATHNITIDKMLGTWSTIEDGLEVGQKIAVPVLSPEIVNQTHIGSEWSRLLGYILSDGTCSFGQSLKFTNIKEEYLSEFEQIVHTLGVGTKRYSKGKGYDVVVTNGRTSKANPILQQLEEYGMRQSKDSKDVPNIVMSLCNHDLALFINRLFAGDGYISTFTRTGRNTCKSEIGIGMPSLSFLQKLQTLLYRFGIDSYINEEIGGKKQKTRFWKLRVSNKQSILRFFDSIGLIYGKEDQCVEAINNAVHLSDKYNRQEGDIKWDYIKSIEYVGMEEVFHITVRDNHTFIANNIVTHNTGKSVIIWTLILYFSCQRKGSKIGVIGPQKSHTERIFKEIHNAIESNPYLKSRVVSSTKQPLYIKFDNGNTVYGYTTGESSGGEGLGIRGETCNILFVDEADYINDDVMDQVVIPTTNSFPSESYPEDPLVFMASTPSGRKGYFRKQWDSGEYFTLHVKASESPSWSPEKETRIKNNTTKLAYTHEYDAEWGDAASGVFSKEDMLRISELSKVSVLDKTAPKGEVIRQYKYSDVMVNGKPNAELLAKLGIKCDILGVDWNKIPNGTRLVWAGFDENHTMHVLHKWKIDASEFTQSVAVAKIRELHALIKFDFIMVDIGYGSMQIEDLHLTGKVDPESKLDKIVKAVPTDGQIDITDIATGEERKTYVKNFLVESMVRYMEQHRVRVPEDEILSEEMKSKKNVEAHTICDQMANYTISRYTANGRPVYECMVGDHDLNALFFTLYGYLTEVAKITNLWDKITPAKPRGLTYDRFIHRMSNRVNGEYDDMAPEGGVEISTENEVEKYGGPTYNKALVGGGGVGRRRIEYGQSKGRFGQAARRLISRRIDRS